MQRKFRRPFLILNGLFLLMTFSGKFAIAFYAVDIFVMAHSALDETSDLLDRMPAVYGEGDDLEVDGNLEEVDLENSGTCLIPRLLPGKAMTILICL